MSESVRCCQSSVVKGLERSDLCLDHMKMLVTLTCMHLFMSVEKGVRLEWVGSAWEVRKRDLSLDFVERSCAGKGAR